LEKKNLMLLARTWSRIFILFSLLKVRIAWQDDHQARGREGMMREREHGIMRLIDFVRSSKHDECQVHGIHLILLGFDDLQVIEELVGTQRGSLCMWRSLISSSL
jgi:hypothetical protein